MPNKLNRKSIPDNNTSFICLPKLYKVAPFSLAGVFILLILMFVFFPQMFTDDTELLPMVMISSIFIIPSIIYGVYTILWKVTIYEDRFSVKSLFNIKTYSYENLEVFHTNSASRFCIDNKKVCVISCLYDNYDSLEIALNKYQKENNITITKSISNVLTIPKIMWVVVGLSGFLFSLFIVLGILDLFLFEENVYCVCFILSSILLVVSLFLSIFIINWKIHFDNEKVFKRGIFRKIKSYNLRDCILTMRDNGNFHLHHDGKKVANILGGINNIADLEYAINKAKPKIVKYKKKK